MVNITYRQQDDSSWAYTMTNGDWTINQPFDPNTGELLATQADAQACAEQQALECGEELEPAAP